MLVNESIKGNNATYTFEVIQKIKSLKLVDNSCLCCCLNDWVMTPCLRCVGLTKTVNFITNIVPLEAIKQLYDILILSQTN